MDRSELEAIRNKIDDIDRKLSELLQERMDLVSQVADYKRKNNAEILDEGREKKVIENVLSSVSNPDYTENIKAIFQFIMDNSKEYQRKRLVEKGRFQKFVLLGEKLSHSISPQIHGMFFKRANIEGQYDLREVSYSEIPDILNILRNEGYTGANVTIPYKTEIMKYLDEISPTALRIGAINTIKIGEKCTGYNTDYFGFGKSLEFFGVSVKGKRCAVLGSGGSSRAIVSYLEDQGAESIVIVTRNTIKAAIKYPHLRCIPINYFSAMGYDLVVNATPVGMYPKTGDSPITKEQLCGAGFVMDIIYNPSMTLLLEYAEELGIPYANGLYMLVAQAISAQEIWQGESINQEITNSIYRELKDEI